MYVHVFLRIYTFHICIYNTFASKLSHIREFLSKCSNIDYSMRAADMYDGSDSDQLYNVRR